MPRVEFAFTAKNSNMANVLQKKSIAVMIAFFGAARGSQLDRGHC